MTEPLPEGDPVSITVSFPSDIAIMLCNYVRRLYSETAEMTDEETLRFAIKRMAFVFARDVARGDMRNQMNEDISAFTQQKEQELNDQIAQLEQLLSGIET